MSKQPSSLLKTGDALGPYRIDELLGKGGMGEVYRGTDTRLGRPVAIKISAREFSDRFEREAKAISSLNHPNICTLYDIGPNYLVMEFVEGGTLARLVEQGPLPLERVLQYGMQIADALAAAHAKGVIHRDLKPANIILTKTGVKVLDFGLAKLSSVSSFLSPASNETALRTQPLTESGSILGTLQYMSPEQAEGKEADERSDIFSFGAVLYEMLTGHRAFDGETKTAILAAILKDQPAPIQQYQPAAPRSLDRVVRKCLEKKPEDRWHSAHDLKQTLELIDLAAPAPGSGTSAANAASGSGIQPAPAVRSRRWALPAVAAVLFVILAAGGWEWWRSSRFTDLPLVRQDVDLGQDIALSGPVQFVPNVVVSPDGTRIAYVARPASGGPQRLYTRRLDQATAVELPGTENPRGPFFSPDGRWLGFVAARKLYKIAVDGGAAAPLMDLRGNFGGAAWGDNFIIVSQGASPLVRIPDSGAAQTTSLGPYAPGEIIQVSPQILPGGKTVLFAGNTGNEGGPPDPDRGSIEAISLVDGHRKTILKGGAFPRYVGSTGRTGHLLYTFKGALYAMPFDPDKLEARGPAVPILSDVLGGLNVAAKFDISNTGTLVYQKGSGGIASGLSTLQWIDANGKSESLLAKPGVYDTPRLSPDGERVAFAVRDGGNQDIQIFEWKSGRTTNLTFGGAQYALPVWTPDGQFVVFRSTNGSLYAARADGSGQPQLISSGQANAALSPWSFSPDGKRLAFMQPAPGTGILKLWTAMVSEQSGELKVGAPEQFLKSESVDVMPMFSPDGKWMAYRSNLSGVAQIYVRPTSGQSGQWVISTQPATSPVWSRNAHDLLYRSADGRVMAVSYTVNGDVFIPDRPRVWLSTGQINSEFDLSPDGKRLITVVSTQQAAAAPQLEHDIVFLQNFFDELRRRAVPSN